MFASIQSSTLSSLFHVYFPLSTSYAEKPWKLCTDPSYYHSLTTPTLFVINVLEHYRTMLENLHLEAITITVGAVEGTSHEKLCKESAFCTLKERRKRRKLLTFHKMINYCCPGYLSNLVPLLVSTTNPYHRRRPMKESFRLIKLNYMQIHSFYQLLSGRTH